MTCQGQWCGIGYSKPYAFRHLSLNQMCLPFHQSRISQGSFKVMPSTIQFCYCPALWITYRYWTWTETITQGFCKTLWAPHLLLLSPLYNFKTWVICSFVLIIITSFLELLTLILYCDYTTDFLLCQVLFKHFLDFFECNSHGWNTQTSPCLGLQ